MSAWYVLSALGLYQVLPGSDAYDIGSPLFKHAVVKLENGKRFTVSAPLNSQKNIFVKSRLLNGKPWPAGVIFHTDLYAGATLQFEMAPVPASEDYNFAIDIENFPFAAVPIFDGPRVFTDRTSVGLSSVWPDMRIFFTIDGSTPTTGSSRYVAPIPISSNTTVRAVAVNAKGETSLPAEAVFTKRPNNWIVAMSSKYSTQYNGGGDEGLIDGIRGTVNFASGEWQGYQGQDFVATVDLQKETEINKVGGGFLQVARSWIWMPTHVEFETSTDGVNFTRVADIKTDLSPEDMESKMRDYLQAISPVKARYVRVKAYNLGKIPPWHPGAGSDAFIFVDEILLGTQPPSPATPVPPA